MMTRPRPEMSSKAAVIALCALAGCGGGGAAGTGVGVPDAGDGGTASDSGTPSDGGALSWFRSCPRPVCQVDGDAGVTPTGAAPCTTQRVGDACAPVNASCDPGLGCGVNLVCETSDPTMQPQGCPISSREAKNDIHYLDPRDLERIAANVDRIRLATFTYKNDRVAREHLGFIIEDDPSSQAVADSRTNVDLYAYTSMVVAAMKVQGQKLHKQEAELAALRRKIEVLEERSKAPLPRQ
jgi:endosialidase-like protein